jgi:hypothetical protein
MFAVQCTKIHARHVRKITPVQEVSYCSQASFPGQKSYVC